jgi:hypothetical protein
LKRLVKLGVVLALVLGAGTHIFYWYWPRERAGAPEPGSYGARLLVSGAYGACLWLPYPHQNLGQLSAALSDGSAFLAAVGRLAGSSSPSLPAFGPFTVPPSREIVACSDLDGENFLVVARVYPGLAAVARLAGTMAGNPWLKGGSVREARGRGDEVQEKVLQISWQDGLWMVRSGPVPQLAAAGPAEPVPEGLGVLHLAREVSELPAGEYRLARREGDLEMTLAGGEAPEPEVADAADGGRDAPVLLAVAGPAWPAESSKPLPPAALALFDVQGGLKIGPIELPGGAVLNPPGGSRWALPARGLAGLLTDSLPRGNAAGWDIVAFDTESLARAEALAPRIAALVPPGAPGGAGGDSQIVLGAWLRPRPALTRMHQMRKGLEKVPLVDRGQVERWHDWETLLSPFASCDRLSLVSARSPSSFRLRLHGCR